MNKVCIWTQTYGSNREELFDYHALDKFDIEFRNNFHNLFTFHNCSDDFYEKIQNCNFLSQIQNKTLLRYNGINYTECVKKSINYIKDLGYDYMVYHEDDSFMQFSPFYESEKYPTLLKLIELIKNSDFNMINLEWRGQHWFHSSPTIKFDDLTIYKTTSRDFGDIKYWQFDGGAYVAKINYLLENLYDDDYFKIGDSWTGERYLQSKWSKNTYDRFTLPFGIYSRYNLLGRNSDYDMNKEKLKNIFYEN